MNQLENENPQRLSIDEGVKTGSTISKGSEEAGKNIDKLESQGVYGDSEYSDPCVEEEESNDDLTMKLPDIVKEAIKESKHFMIPSESFTNTQKEINITSRLAAIDWLLRIVLKVQYQRGTLFNAVYMLDLILSKKSIAIDDLQLTSITCLWISAKVEEIADMGSLQIFLKICKDQFTPEQFVAKELEIFKLLDGRFNFPTAQIFVHPLLKAIGSVDKIETVQFYLDLSLMDFDLICYPSPVVAVAAIAAAMGNRCPLRKLLKLINFDSTQDAIVAIKKIAYIATFVLERKNTAMYSVYDSEMLQKMKSNVEKSLQYFCNYL